MANSLPRADIKYNIQQTSISNACPRFIYIWLRSDIAKRAIDEVTIGSTQQALTIVALKSLKLKLPPLPEQKAIAHILGSLDDKIELNRRMTQALFKSWFTDFDPVLDNAIHAGNPIPDEFEARAEVRRQVLAQNQNDECSMMSDELKNTHNSEFITQHSHHALFPDSFQTSELGPIPTGWEVKPLDRIADYKNGLALQKFRPKEDEDPLPIVKIAQLKAGEATWDEVASPQISLVCGDKVSLLRYYSYVERKTRCL